MSHAAPGRRKRKRREVIDDHDAETIALFERINRPARTARQFVRNAVAPFLTERRSIEAAIRMTEAIRRYAKAGSK